MSFYKKLEKQKDIFLVSNSNISKRIVEGKDFLNKKIQYFSFDKELFYIDAEDNLNVIGINRKDDFLDKKKYMFTEDE